MSYVVIWDIETVPDLEGFARANGLVGKAEDEIRAAIGDKFPKPAYHSIVCIGALLAEWADGAWRVRAVGAPHVGERPEPELIRTFLAKIEELRPKLVTFNGSSFDFPVLRYRAMLHGLPARGLSARPYFNRFTEDSVDVCDVLSSFGASTRMGLDELSRLMGLEGKPEGLDGSRVDEFYRAGRLKEISDYCVADVVNTYRLWLRYELFRGALTEEEFAASGESIAAAKTP